MFFPAPSTFLRAYSKPCWDWRRVCRKSWCWYPRGFRPFGSNCRRAWDGCRSPGHQWGPRQSEATRKAPNYLIRVQLWGKYLGKRSWAEWGPCRMQQSWLWNSMGKSSALVLKTSCTHHPLQFHMECVRLEFRVQNRVCESCVASDSRRKRQKRWNRAKGGPNDRIYPYLEVYSHEQLVSPSLEPLKKISTWYA